MNLSPWISLCDGHSDADQNLSNKSAVGGLCVWSAEEDF